jgi:hypothetical protein
MAGQKTSLITGSNAKIKVNGKTLAYATDFQYSVEIQTVPVETMGRYEVLSNEAIALIVSGSFSVVRYTQAAATAGTTGQAASGLGNGVGRWGMNSHFNPGLILASLTVDIELYQKFVNDPEPGVSTAGVASPIGPDQQVRVKFITDARLTSMGGSINKRGILMESFRFVAIGLSDDSFDSAPSGEVDLSD